MKHYGIKLDDETRKRLHALAEWKDRSVHWLMIQAIKCYLDEEEKVEQQKREDLAEWEEYILTGEALSHASVLTSFEHKTENAHGIR